MKKQTQVFYIHGGMTFKSKKDYLRFLHIRVPSIETRIRWWSGYLQKALGNSFHVITPRMPLQDFAQYEEWKIHFERHFDFLEDDIILMGGSLGGIFLAKYLSENKFPKKILSTYFICPPFDDSLPTEDLAGGFELSNNLSLIEKNCSNLTFLFSKDDEVVPIEQAQKYKKKLPKARFVFFDSKNGHFQIEEFPEIVEMIRKDVEKLS